MPFAPADTFTNPSVLSAAKHAKELKEALDKLDTPKADTQGIDEALFSMFMFSK